MSVARHHNEWLSLVETSGPFLSLPVLLRVFPQGLDSRDASQAGRLREAYEDWLERGAKDPSVHTAWIRGVLTDLLGYPSNLLAEGQTLPAGLEAVMATYGETLRPDLALKGRADDQKPALLVCVYPPNQDLEKPVAGKFWKASPGTRMMELLHAADVPVGLVTNGEEWMLVSARRNETTGFASWYADLWMQEPLTLRAFHSLLHLRRLIGVADTDTLSGLLLESSKEQQEVTDQLGYQVRKAVEVLVQAFDRIDAESGRTLLADVAPKTLYDGALTVMMRLVFLFSAEERGLLLLGDPFYDQNYAVSTLSEILRERADQYGEEVLERRHDSWCRLLATFRAVHGGVEHEAMRLPPYGGTLFNPDRYPFLEGRATAGISKAEAGRPLLINNRVVLHLLEALQVLRVKVPGGSPETRRLSFSALDIEQIGHVYEGLLDHTAKRAEMPFLGLAGAQDKEPEIALQLLEELSSRDTVALVEFVANMTGRRERALARLLKEAPAVDHHSLLMTCGQDHALAERVRPFIALVRKDSFGRFMVIQSGSIYVTEGNDRRSTGTHYTPRTLTEPIVRHTLEPLVYNGPTEGLPPPEWTLKDPKAILALKVCDMAMGSGAFLVEACRYLAARLVEAWENIERQHPGAVVVGPEGEMSVGRPTDRLIPADSAERLAIARRYIADRCIYGVDINPMAVEMAKLSMWLVTMQPDRPFTFIDHAFKCGDSLLGVSSILQVEKFSLRPGERQGTFATANLTRYIDEATAKRRALEGLASNDYAQIQDKKRLHAAAEAASGTVKVLADALVAFELRGADGVAYEEQRTDEAEQLQELMRRDAAASIEVSDTKSLLASSAREALHGRPTFHWPVEFPEVFVSGGFDGVVGNPPFMGGTLATEWLGADYMSTLQRVMPPWHGKADYVVGFFKRLPHLLHVAGKASLVATSSLLRGETLDSGLRDLWQQHWRVYSARGPYKWPGTATLEVVNASFSRDWGGEFVLDGEVVVGITEEFTAGEPDDRIPYELADGRLEGALGVKLCPANREIQFKEYTRALVEAPELDQFFVPALGGDEIYDLVDFAHAPRSVLWEKLVAFVQGGGIVTQNGGITVLSPAEYVHSAPAAGLMAALARSRYAFACGETSTSLRFCRVPNTDCILKHKLIVFPANSWAVFALLQSEVHGAWAWRWGLRRESRLVYSPKRCSLTFPLPPGMKSQFSDGPPGLSELGKSFHEFRSHLIEADQVGLRRVYNRFHDPNDKTGGIQQLRKLQVEMDNAIAHAYGWSDLRFGHQFVKTRQGMRYTISEAARQSVLDRLLVLNHERSVREKSGGQKKRPRVHRGKAAGGVSPGGLFE